MTEAASSPAEPGVLPAATAKPLVGTLRVPQVYWVGAIAVGVLAIGLSLAAAWKTDQRVQGLERELVRREQESAAQSAEAHVLAKQAQEGATEAVAKVALLDARLAEVATQRDQLEDLIQSLSRSRDENIVVDIESAVRVALQQAAITGSAEPLVSTLKQSDDRLAHYNQPRLEGVRRAIARDLDRVKAVHVADISSLTIRLDEAVRLVDELPVLAVAEPHRDAARTSQPNPTPASAAAPRATASAPPASASTSDAGVGRSVADSVWPAAFGAAWSDVTGRVWGEIKALVRVTRIDHPEAVLAAPDQAFFLKENLKLRLLNARLALLSRQFETTQSDLMAAQSVLDRYFDRSARRTVLAADLLRDVAAQARLVGVPRPDDTLAALAAASAGR